MRQCRCRDADSRQKQLPAPDCKAGAWQRLHPHRQALQVRTDLIELQLSHAVKDQSGRACDRMAYLVERKKMMQAWADYLDGLKGDANDNIQTDG